MYAFVSAALNFQRAYLGSFNLTFEVFLQGI